MSWHKRVEQLERRAAMTQARQDPDVVRARIMARLAALGERLRSTADLAWKRADPADTPVHGAEHPALTYEHFRAYFDSLRARVAQRRTA